MVRQAVHPGLRRGALLALLLAGVLSGCVTLSSTSKPATIYDLAPPAPAAFAALTSRSSAQLLLPLPTASDALAGNRLAVRDGAGRLSYYPDVTWSDQLPGLVQSLLQRAFENSGAVKAVGKPGQSLAIDDQVIVDIRSFGLEVGTGAVAHVELGVKLLDDRNGRIRATRVFDVRRPAASDRSADVLAALRGAADQAMTDIVGWTAGAL